MSQYRVDRNDSRTSTPCGMNSLRYLGDSHQQAVKAYEAAQPGLDHWNQPNVTYGVTLAVWGGPDRLTGDYVVKRSKFLPEAPPV